MDKTVNADAAFYEMVCQRIGTLGHTVTEDDKWLIEFIIDKTFNHVRIVCNISELPAELENTLCDMVAGEFLKQLFDSGKLGDIEIEQALSSITMGDTSMSFANGGEDARTAFRALLDGMINKDGELVCFRRLRW